MMPPIIRSTFLGELAKEPTAIMLGVLALTSVIFGILEVFR